VKLSLCSRCERYIRSVELTHGLAVRDLRGWEVTRALVPLVLALFKRFFRNSWRFAKNCDCFSPPQTLTGQLLVAVRRGGPWWEDGWMGVSLCSQCERCSMRITTVGELDFREQATYRE
jgi:hypothetical protein